MNIEQFQKQVERLVIQKQKVQLETLALQNFHANALLLSDGQLENTYRCRMHEALDQSLDIDCQFNKLKEDFAKQNS